MVVKVVRYLTRLTLKKKGVETPDLSIVDKTETHDTRKIVAEKLR